uniref:RNA-dependent RNA polymerase n=1 Tax=Swanson narna-like virus TaxID=2716638 RepID=A0A6G7PRZ5_9VIRU|nr:RNA-dependent RNA polymerase [Swanson narna-like virus]
MAWPFSRLPPGSGTAESFDGTLLGSFWIVHNRTRESIRGLYTKRYSPKERHDIISSLDGFQSLPRDVLRKISEYDERRMRHLIYTWRGIEDNIRLSSLPVQLGERPHLLGRLWRWCISTHVYNPNQVLRTWKKLCLYLQRSMADLPTEELPRELPGTRRGKLGHDWYQVYPWLWDIFHNIRTKTTAEFVTMASQSRNFPVPVQTEESALEEIFDFTEELKKPRLPRPRWLRETAKVLGRDARSLVDKSRIDLFPHISASFSASENFSRSRGGKGVEILKGFLDYFVYSQPAATLRAETWFGAEYVTIKGVPKMYTMCRRAPLDFQFPYFLSSSFRKEEAPETLLHMFLAETLGEEPPQVMEESIFGLDRDFPKQLHQLCIERLIEDGFFEDIRPYYNHLDAKVIAYASKTWSKPIPCRAHCVREPGGKIRWVTMEPAHVNMFIQPLAHMIAAGLGMIPSLYSAFNRSWKAWDFGDMLAIKPPTKPKWGFRLGVYDLTSASNNLDRGVLADILEGFTETFFPQDLKWKSYLRLVMSILFRDRHVFIYKDEVSREITHNFIATNGILMGNPLTKELLVMTSEIIHRYATRLLKGDVRFFTSWLIAGDDVAIYCRRPIMEKILDLHTQLGNVIKREKSFFSEYYAPFCQGGLFIKNIPLFHGKRLMYVDYNNTIVTDTIMSRLLTPFGTESLQSNPTAKNPVIGKGAALSSILKYYPYPHRVPQVIQIFHRNMGSLIPTDPMAFLPGEIGGYDLPHLLTDDELYARIMEAGSTVLFPIFRLLRSGERVPIWLEFLLRDARTGVSARGLENPTLDPMIKEYEAALLNYAKVESWTFKQVSEECKAYFRDHLKRDPLTVNDRDVRKYARLRGLMNSYEFAIHVDRSSAMRIFFLVAAGLFPLEKALPSKEKIPSPTLILEGFRKSEYWMRVKYDPFTSIRDLFRPENTLEGIKLFREWFYGGRPTVNKQLGTIYLRKSCYRDSLNGMRVPIWEPRSADEPFVKGSLEDPYRQPDKDLFIGSTVHVDRLGRSVRDYL